MIWYSRV